MVTAQNTINNCWNTSTSSHDRLDANAEMLGPGRVVDRRSGNYDLRRLGSRRRELNDRRGLEDDGGHRHDMAAAAEASVFLFRPAAAGELTRRLGNGRARQQLRAGEEQKQRGDNPKPGHGDPP
jgi:hypothetical protein